MHSTVTHYIVPLTSLHVVESEVYVSVVLCFYHMLQPNYILVPTQRLYKGGKEWGMRKIAHKNKPDFVSENVYCSGAKILRNPTLKQIQQRRTCKYIISRKVLCASVAFLNASKHFFSATTFLDRFSIAFHTIPYACKKSLQFEIRSTYS